MATNGYILYTLVPRTSGYSPALTILPDEEIVAVDVEYGRVSEQVGMRGRQSADVREGGATNSAYEDASV